MFGSTSFQIVMNCLSHLMDVKESTTWETLSLAPDNVIDLIWSTVASCSTTENTLYAAVRYKRLSNDRSLYNKPSTLAPAGPDSSERLSNASTTDSLLYRYYWVLMSNPTDIDVLAHHDRKYFAIFLFAVLLLTVPPVPSHS